MNHVRPHQILGMADSYDEEIRYFMPPHEGGSLSAIESVLLLKLARRVDPAFIFEFGTYRGDTTRLLLENLRDSRIYTLDIPNLTDIVFEGGDLDIAERSLLIEKRYNKSSRRHWVRQIYQDSLYFNEELFPWKFQFVFIDGNHKLKYVQSDTQKAFNMISSECSCIAWHDYGNPEFPEMTEYLDTLSQTRDLFHIEETKLVFWPSGFRIGRRLGGTP